MTRRRPWGWLICVALVLPVFLVVGAVEGIGTGFAEWRRDLREPWTGEHRG